MQQSDYTTYVSFESRESSRSARSRLPDGESLSRKTTERRVKQWHSEKEKLGKDDLDAREIRNVLIRWPQFAQAKCEIN